MAAEEREQEQREGIESENLGEICERRLSLERELRETQGKQAGTTKMRKQGRRIEIRKESQWKEVGWEGSKEKKLSGKKEKRVTRIERAAS